MAEDAQEQQKSQRAVGFHTLMTLAAVIVVIAGLKAAGGVILPILLAGFLAVLTMPPISWLTRKGLPKWASVTVVFLGVIVGFVLVSVFIGASVRSFSDNVPTYQSRIAERLEPLEDLIDEYNVLDLLGGNDTQQVNGVQQPPDTQQPTDAQRASESEDESNLVGVIMNQLNTGRLMTWFAGALGAISSVLSDMVFVLLTMSFMLAEAAGLPTKIRVAMGQPDADLTRFTKILDDLQGYLGIKTLVSLATGFVATLLCVFTGVDYPMLWGLVAFLLNYVPTLGSIIAAIPPVILALIQFGWERALIVLIGYIALNQVFGSVLEPRLMGRRLGLSTLVVFLSLVFWGFVWGPLGMLLCVPLTMIVKILLENSDDLQWVSVLLGSGAELRDRRGTMVPPPPKQPESEESAA